MCLQGTARVVVLDRETGETFTEDIGDDNPVAIYIPGRHAHGFEALTDLALPLPRDRGVRPGRPGRARDSAGTTRASPTSGARHRRSCRSGTPPRPDHGRGRAARRARSPRFSPRGGRALTRADWDVAQPAAARLRRRISCCTPPPGPTSTGPRTIRRAQRRSTSAGRGTSPRSARRSSYFSTDYVFDGRKREPYVESDEPNPRLGLRAHEAPGRGAAGDGWIVRSSWLFGPTGHNFVRTMLAPRRASGTRCAVVDDQRGSPDVRRPSRRGDAAIVELPDGVWHVAAEGDCTWAEFAEAIFEEAGLACRVRRISSAELGRPAPRPAYSVLRSERANAPRLPHWREGLRACLARL